MRTYSIGTLEYDIDMGKLMNRRLKQFQCSLDASSDESRRSVSVEIEAARDAELWMCAAAELVSKDIAHFEMARIINNFLIPIGQKQLALPQAVKSARTLKISGRVRRMIAEHYKEYDHLNVEGFVRFKMRDILDAWALCADRAVEEIILRSEYLELMDVLSEYVRSQPPKIRYISVILHPDGSCTLTDDSDSRIDCASCSDDSVLSLLISLAPERITVYDLSGNSDSLLSEALMRVFVDRVHFF